jgi:putative aldouronate transport system substrate-binding protein
VFILLLILAIVFPLSLFAVGGSQRQQPVGDPNAPTRIANPTYSGFNPLNYGMTRFANPVTIKIPVFDRARDDVPDVSNNYFTRWIQEQFGNAMNVRVEFVPINRTDTMTAYNLLLASNNWPTIFMEYDWPKVTQWSADGALAAFDLNWFRQNAPTWFQTAGGKEAFDMFTLGGRYIFAPALRPYYATMPSWITFYRKDWLRQAGIELWTTWDEYADTMSALQQRGLTRGKPILPKQPFNENFQFYGTNPWPLDEEYWVMYSDVNVASLPASGMYNELKRQNILFNRGLFSNEFELDVEGSGSGVQAITDFINGEAFTYGGYLAPSMPDLTAFYANNPNAELGIIYNNSVYWEASGQGGIVPQGRAANPAGYFIGFSNRASNDEKLAALLYMEWMARPDVLDFMQWGRQGVNYTVNSSGVRELTDWRNQGDMWMGYQGNKDYWAVVVEVRMTGTPEETLAVNSPKGLPQDFTQELIDVYRLNDARFKAGLIYTDPFFTVEINSVNRYSGTLRALFQEYATALVKARPADFDALYQRYVQQYRAAGFQAIEDERLAAYRAGNTTKLPDVAAGRAPFVNVHPMDVQSKAYTIFPSTRRN